MTENKELDREGIPIRSEVVQEIMGKVPHVLIRWGNTLILILAVGMLILSYFLRYPDTIHAQIELTPTNPTSEIYARTEGKLTGIMVVNGDVVQKEAVLANVITSEGTILELRAQTAGSAYAISFLTEGSPVDEGELLFKIIPPEGGIYQGIMRLPSQALSKIRPGQEVRIRLSDKAMEQNVIVGSVAQVSQVADEQGLIAIQILMKNGLTSTTGQKLAYTPGVRGNAEVIVENPRLIEHFFYQLRNIFK